MGILSSGEQEITVGDVLRYLQKDQEGAGCLACVSRKACPFLDRCAFTMLWHRVKTAAYKIYDATTMQDLLNTNEPDDKILGQYGLGERANHTSLPDILGVTLKELLQRVDDLEARIDGHDDDHGHIHAPQDATWAGADFSI